MTVLTPILSALPAFADDLKMNKWADVVTLRMRDGATLSQDCSQSWCDSITTLSPNQYGTVRFTIEATGNLTGRWECSIDKGFPDIRSCAGFWPDQPWRLDQRGADGHWHLLKVGTFEEVNAVEKVLWAGGHVAPAPQIYKVTSVAGATNLPPATPAAPSIPSVAPPADDFTGFECPESLDPSKRLKATNAYLHWVMEGHKDWDITKVVNQRIKLLGMHGCSMVPAMAARSRMPNRFIGHWSSSADQVKTCNDDPPSVTTIDPSSFLGHESICMPISIERSGTGDRFRIDTVCEVEGGNLSANQEVWDVRTVQGKQVLVSSAVDGSYVDLMQPCTDADTHAPASQRVHSGDYGDEVPIAGLPLGVLQKIYLDFDNVCRGGAGGEDKTDAFCDYREVVSRAIYKDGFCLAYPAYTWHRCTSRDTKPW